MNCPQYVLHSQFCVWWHDTDVRDVQEGFGMQVVDSDDDFQPNSSQLHRAGASQSTGEALEGTSSQRARGARGRGSGRNQVTI